MNNTDWQLPPDFSREYLEACKLAAINDDAFANFRTNDRISCIIENTSKEWADQALDAMGLTPTMIRYLYTCKLMIITSMIYLKCWDCKQSIWLPEM